MPSSGLAICEMITAGIGKNKINIISFPKKAQILTKRRRKFILAKARKFRNGKSRERKHH